MQKKSVDSIICTLDDIAILASKIAAMVAKGDVIALSGEVGAGKTTLASLIIRSIIGPSQNVVSPTYQVIKIYKGPSFRIAHVDLYRIQVAQDVTNLGLLEIIDDHLTIIEWPERVLPLLKTLDGLLHINISIQSEYSRIITADFHSKWATL